MRRVWSSRWVIFCAALAWGCADKAGELPTPVEAPVVAPMSPGRIDWLSWTQRDSASALGRPILLFLYSQRAFWCRDLVARCFDDPVLARDIRRIALPIWVDADRRPDVFERYSMGGVPSVVFLKPDGAWITGSTYLDPEDLDDLLRRVFILFDNPKRMDALEVQRTERLRREALRIAQNPRPTLVPSRALLTRAVDSVRVAALRGDRLSPQSLLALVESGDVAIRRVGIDALLSVVETRQDADGSFFLSTLTPGGELVDREKHLGVNAELLLALAQAATVTEQDPFRQAVVMLGDALLTQFRTPGDSLLCAGWAGWPDTAGRSLRDPTLYSGWNAAAVSGLVAAYEAVQTPYLSAESQRIFNGLKVRFRRADGLFGRTVDEDGPVFLEDQVLTMRAALDIYAASGRRDALVLARELADALLEHFADPSGALRDRLPESGVAQMPAIDRWLPSGNGIAAQALVRLTRETGRPVYRAAAERLLTALCGPHVDDLAHTGALTRGLRGFLDMDRVHDSR